MKEEDIFRITNLIIIVGAIFMLLGITIELEEIEDDIITKEKEINELKLELNKCKQN